tara:strand:- start:427 stop:1113 length:687 start_codon:yes stop_codon:yes gene_type:complete
MGEGQDNTGIADAAGYGPGSTGTADPGGGGPMGSAGASGSGVHDGSPGSVSDADGAAAYAGLRQGINAAIAAGLDPYSSKAQNVIAAGIMSGQFGNPESFGINVDMEAPEVAGFMDQYGPGQSSGLAGIAGLVGYNPDIGFMQNIANMAIPGRNTPLGALSAVPGLVGASNTVSGIVGLANTIAGKLGIASTTNPSAPDTALSGSVVGKGSIAGSYGANTGIASGPKF